MNTGTSTTSLLEPQKNENNSMEIPFCGCLSVQFYQPYFDVDTSDVQNRLQQALIFCGRQETFMTFVGTKPDVYGPFWIATTLVFTLSVSANMHGWLQSWLNGNDLWRYNFQSVVSACSIIYGFSFLPPAALWFIFRQFEIKQHSKLANCICLYGYSMFIFIPATLICILPSALAKWLVLLGAGVSSGLFLLRNLAPILMEEARQQTFIILGAIAFVQLAFVLCLKFMFY